MIKIAEFLNFRWTHNSMCLNKRLAQILSIIVNFREILMTALPSQSHRRGNGWADGEAEAAGDFILS